MKTNFRKHFTLTERITQLLDYNNITKHKFYQDLGLSSDFLNKPRETGTNEHVKILQYFPDVNPDWLLTGEGEMLRAAPRIAANAREAKDVLYMNVPLVNVAACAGRSHSYGDPEYLEDLPSYLCIMDNLYKGKHKVFEVGGDSMDDGSRAALYDKDKILCREVKPELWASKLHLNQWFFVIVHKNDGIMVKQITKHDVEKGIITCHALNELFEDFELSLSEVAELYNVVRIVDRNVGI